MPRAVVNPPFGVQDIFNVRAIGSISPNTRAQATLGKFATQLDFLVFPGPASVTGMWTIPNTRVSVSGVRLISASSQGISLSGQPSTVGPLIIAITDPRISIS